MQPARFQAGFFTNSRKAKLFIQKWVFPEADARGLVFLLHEYGGHGPNNDDAEDYYKPLLHLLLTERFNVYSLDFEGHGRSEGERGAMPTFDQIVKDVSFHVHKELEPFSSRAARGHRARPAFVYGEGLGGAVAAKLALAEPDTFAGLVMVAPRLQPTGDEPSAFARTFGRVWGGAGEYRWVDAAFSQEHAREHARNDELALQDGTLRLTTANAIVGAEKELAKTASSLTVPLLVLHGTEDSLVPIDHSREFVDAVTAEDATLQEYEGAWHALWAEPPQRVGRAFLDLSTWLLERAPLPHDRKRRGGGGDRRGRGASEADAAGQQFTRAADAPPLAVAPPVHHNKKGSAQTAARPPDKGVAKKKVAPPPTAAAVTATPVKKTPKGGKGGRKGGAKAISSDLTAAPLTPVAGTNPRAARQAMAQIDAAAAEFSKKSQGKKKKARK
jgi:acylglycerol lipase